MECMRIWRQIAAYDLHTFIPPYLLIIVIFGLLLIPCSLSSVNIFSNWVWLPDKLSDFA